MKFSPVNLTCNREQELVPGTPVPATPTILTAVILGVSSVTTLSVAGELTDPEGAGFRTTIFPVLAFARSVALSETCNVALSRIVVGRSDPFHCATEFDSKPFPVTVTVAATPVRTSVGAIEAITGSGLLTRNLAPVESPPPGAGF